MASIGIDVRLWKETGIGRYVRNLVENLSEIDDTTQYVLFVLPADLASVKNQVVHGKFGKNFVFVVADIPWHGVKEQIEFPRLLGKYNLDLMHFPYFSVPVFYKKPFVVTVHDLIINHFPTGRATTLPLPFYLAKRFGYSYVLKNAIKNSKIIIAPSIATKQEILDHYSVSDARVVVTPEGVDKNITDFKPAIFKPKSPYFLYVGNAYPHKNVEKMIEAFLLFSEKHPDYTLKLAGKKDFFYKKLIEKTHNPKIEFMGYVEDNDLAKLYKFSTASIIPSLMEGFGLTTLEAMSLGSLVIASDIPSIKEIAGDTVHYFKPTDVLSLVASMEEVSNLSEKKRHEMVQTSKKHVEKFSWEKTAKLTLDVYNSCLNTK